MSNKLEENDVRCFGYVLKDSKWKTCPRRWCCLRYKQKDSGNHFASSVCDTFRAVTSTEKFPKYIGPPVDSRGVVDIGWSGSDE